VRVALIFLLVATDQKYLDGAKRFAATYRQFPAGIEHELIIGLVGCGGELFSGISSTIFKGIKHRTIDCASVKGWDSTCHRFIAGQIDADFVVCCASTVHFKRTGWLKLMVDARKQYGEGLYGSAASLEVRPHIRTGFFGCDRKNLIQYDQPIRNRKEGGLFEKGPNSITLWHWRHYLPAVMVAWDYASYCPEDWTPCGSRFRHGDQSNLIAFDRHEDIFDHADSWEKTILTNAASGKYIGWIGKVRRAFDIAIQYFRFANWLERCGILVCAYLICAAPFTFLLGLQSETGLIVVNCFVFIPSLIGAFLLYLIRTNSNNSQQDE
jgi:hypothetical protein